MTRNPNRLAREGRRDCDGHDGGRNGRSGRQCIPVVEFNEAYRCPSRRRGAAAASTEYYSPLTDPPAARRPSVVPSDRTRMSCIDAESSNCRQTSAVSRPYSPSS